jgi:site-specific DNA-methyltransferase (cytosine-N4-specific)
MTSTTPQPSILDLFGEAHNDPQPAPAAARAIAPAQTEALAANDPRKGNDPYSDPEVAAATELHRRACEARYLCLSDAQRNERTKIGRQTHNLFHGRVRRHQQTLKRMGILERLPGDKGAWRLTQHGKQELHAAAPGVALMGFSTRLGVAVWGSCEDVYGGLEAPITLAISSPPYPLNKPRSYGNPTIADYIDFICRAFEPIVRRLVPGGSVCLNISNDIFEPGLAARSLYRERLLIALHDRLGLSKMDEIPWINLSKPPGPVQWASKQRVQLNVGWEPIYWLTNDPSKVRSDNRRVLEAHSKRHLELIQNGGESREGKSCDGAYVIHAGSYGNPTPGKIPKNVIIRGHACADQRAYKKAARALGLPAHGAPMPLDIPRFLIKFLSEPNDLVVDPFGGSLTTGKAAEQLGRRWLLTEMYWEYVRGGAERFRGADGFRMGVPHLQTLLAA